MRFQKMSLRHEFWNKMEKEKEKMDKLEEEEKNGGTKLPNGSTESEE